MGEEFFVSAVEALRQLGASLRSKSMPFDSAPQRVKLGIPLTDCALAIGLV
jgi:hypothetical protein